MKSIGWKDIAELAGMAAIVLSLFLVAYELRQNTLMMRAQTRDSMTTKQMIFSEWFATSRYAADVAIQGRNGIPETGTAESVSYRFMIHGILREWENSHYQYRQGLFDQVEFEPRKLRWKFNMQSQGYREIWAETRETFSPEFRDEIDRIVEENAAERR